MTASEIRKAFLDFFASKGHQIVSSAPIVIKNDPTLMFTNAGMNQFKDIFLGEATAKYKRVVDSQRCLRVSGKHNDLEEVGIDTYHHTMFEMLGNWSFGDYFKKEAIAWSWELLTEVYKIDKTRLYVTIFEGDEKEGLPKDQEAYDYWKLYVPEDHILSGNKKDNFWEMGETGPCGPCSEIHYDNRSDGERQKISGATLVNADDPQVIEIWNNVFMQFNRLKDGTLQPLPAKHVDTGMGFERLVRVLQLKDSNYDTDVFQELIQFIAEKSKKKYNNAAKPGDADWNTAVAMRVLADHVRAVSFTIADGQRPSNNKAGYVIRRILRRAVRYQYQYLGFKEPFLNTLVPLLAEQFKGVFDELYSQKDFVQKVVLDEETAFLRTLAAGIDKFNELVLPFTFYKNGTFIMDPSLDTTSTLEAQAKYQQILDSKIPGEVAFMLSDTYGFPIDLTELMARESGFTVDMDGFNILLEEQKKRSRLSSGVNVITDWISSPHLFNYDYILNKDEDSFVGYREYKITTKIIQYRNVEYQGREFVQIVLEKTPFYAEGGGQVGDTGTLTIGNQIIEVLDTKKENGLTIHYANMEPEKDWLPVVAEINLNRRYAIQNNHSATHLLHAALKQVLGSDVNQKGSLVNDQYLRFDFSYSEKVNEIQLDQIEAIVNRRVRDNILVEVRQFVPYLDAISMSGVNALFGEKYGEFVRLVIIDDDFSKELCGGTHVQYTGQIGYFKIISESAVGAGVRRIEAITGIGAENYINEQSKLVHQLKELLKNPKDIGKSIETLLDENNKLKKEIERSVLEKSSGLKNELAKKVQTINGINFIAEKVALPNADAIKNLAYQLKDIVSDLFLVLAANIDGKPNLTVMISESLVKNKGLNAGNIIRELAKEIKGGGGGQPFFATAGGSDVNGLDKALEKATSFIL